MSTSRAKGRATHNEQWHVPNAQRCVSATHDGMAQQTAVPTACLSIVRTLTCEQSRVQTNQRRESRGLGKPCAHCRRCPVLGGLHHRDVVQATRKMPVPSSCRSEVSPVPIH